MDKRKKRENKTVILPIRFKESDIKKIEEKSQKLNITKSSLIRKLALERNINVVSYTDKLTVSQIRKIGVNINQIAKRVNTFKERTDFPKELKQVTGELKFLHEILKKLKTKDKIDFPEELKQITKELKFLHEILKKIEN